MLAWCAEALAPLGQKPERHHRLLIRELEKISSGETDRLMVLMPPGSAKSMYASILFSAWWFTQHPRTAIIAASHTADLAERFGRKARNLIESNSDTLGYDITSDTRAVGRWETTSGGEYFASGVGGSITGRRADLAIIDDPVASRKDAESETVRQSTWDWYRNDMYTRLKPGAGIVVIMTRWHEEDLGGRLLAEMESGGDQWKVLKLPALANATDDPLGRAIDEPLWPEWEDAEALSRKRKAIGERDFGALFQQDPRPSGTSFFDVQNCLIDGEPVEYPIRPDYVYAIIDTATKTGAKHDGTGCTFFARTEGRGIPLVVLDWDIAKIEGALLEVWLPTVFERLEQLAFQTKARMGSLGAFIEDKNSGTVLLQHAARREWPAQPIESKLTAAGKDERAISVMGHVSAGEVKLSRYAYDKLSIYNGRSGNHFLMQVFRFQIGLKDQEDDLLDTWAYGIAIGLGNAQGYA